MARPVILACAVTGSADSTAMNPAVPVTPEQIASEVIAANKAGAAIAHIHVRNPETGKASTKLEYYEEVVNRIRDSGSPVIINLTTGPGGRFVPDPKDPMKAGPTSGMMTARERVVIGCRFGLGQQRESTLAEVAEELKLSIERVRQIQVSALAKLAAPALRRQFEVFLN